VKDTLEEPRRIGRYVLGEVLGRGAMGVVYRAEDPLIARTVAIKLLHFPRDLDPDQLPTMRERFLREAQTAGNLDHPNIVRVLDAGCDEETQELYLVMEYLPGASLEALSKDGALSREKICELVKQVGSALDAAHARGVIHRDVKPANILYADDATAKITDFGIARVNTSQLTQDNRDLGTPIYMSPEQVTGKSLDGRADLFSLGVMAYHLLTGVPPFSGRNMVSVAYQIVHATPPLPSSIVPDLPHAIDRVLARILAKDPDERYGSGREFAEEFTRVLLGLPADTHTAKVPKPWRGKLDSRILALIGFGIVVSGIVLVSYGSRRSGTPPAETASASVRAPRPPSGELVQAVVPPPASAKPGKPDAGKPKTSAARAAGQAEAPRAKAAKKPAGVSAETAPSGDPKGTAPDGDGEDGAAPSAAEAPLLAHAAAPRTSPAQQLGAPRATGFMAFQLGTSMRGGTLVVALDGKPILSEEFEKKHRLMPYQTTRWPEIEVPAGRHELSARIESSKGDVKVSAPVTVEVEPAQTLNLRMVLKDDSVVFKSGG